MNLCILIPMKDPPQSKQRLSAVLAPLERDCIAVNLFRNSLAFFQRHFPGIPLLVVTPSSTIATITRQYGAEVVLEASADGLNCAITRGTQAGIERGFSAQLLIPADIVRLEVAEFKQLLAVPRAERSVIVCPSRDGGTNALLSTPPDVLEFQFGIQSAERHLHSAQRNNIQCRQLDLEHIALDLDTAEDLEQVSATLLSQLKTPNHSVWGDARGLTQ